MKHYYPSYYSIRFITFYDIIFKYFELFINITDITEAKITNKINGALAMPPRQNFITIIF